MKNTSVSSYQLLPKIADLANYNPELQPGKLFDTGFKKSDDTLKIAFLFSGQGSQYPGMGKELYRTNSTFRNAFDSCNSFLKTYLGFSLAEMLYEKDEEEIAYSQLALFVVEFALAQVWLARGVKPTALLGHSAGEYVAACLAGVFTPTDALKLISAREQLLAALPDPGKMAVVFAEALVVEKLLKQFPNQAAIAAINGPCNTSIAGKQAVITDLVKQFRQMGFHAQDLNASFAYHSPLIDEVQNKLYAFAQTIDYAPTKIAIISTLTGKLLLPGAQLNARYWCEQLRETVLFLPALKTLEDYGYHTLLEVGPNPILLSMARESLKLKSTQLPSLRKGRPEEQQMRESLAKLFAQELKASGLELEN